MKILIAHHVETMWADSLRRIANIDFQSFVERIYEYYQKYGVDKLILTRFEDSRLEPEHYLFEELNYEVHEYAYGWDQEIVLNDEHGEYTDGGNHSEYVRIENWMYELKGHEVCLAGCFDGECIEDMEIALSHCKVPFKRIDELIH